MSEITINMEYLETLKIFGGVDKLIDEAIEEYLIAKVVERIRMIRQKVSKYEKQYNLKYSDFKENMQTNQAFYEKLDKTNPLWEQDILEWEYWVEELKDWTTKLEDILTKSNVSSKENSQLLK